MKPGRVRPIAICIIRKGNAIFVAEGYDSVKAETFYRPLGGKIEFGERGIDTVKRELLEEIGAGLKNVRYLRTLENIFVYEGQNWHEIVLVYEGEFADPALYQAESVNAAEEGGEPFKAVWKPLAEFGPAAPLYPDGLPEMLGVEYGGAAAS
jgi:8-oxo-dGTP pyrophosphatase MutT (NUDIX family)